MYLSNLSIDISRTLFCIQICMHYILIRLIKIDHDNISEYDLFEIGVAFRGGRHQRDVKTSLFVRLHPPPSNLCRPTWKKLSLTLPLSDLQPPTCTFRYAG